MCLAGEHVCLGYVQHVDGAAARAGEGRRDRADSAGCWAGEGEHQRRGAAGNEVWRDRCRLIGIVDARADGPKRVPVGPEDRDADRCHRRAEVERCLNADMLT